MIDFRVDHLPEALEGFPDNTFHAVLCDPPYGLSSPPPPELLLRWLAGEDVKHGPGFLGRQWDSLPPGPAVWSEVLRVMRPGGILMAFGYSGTGHRLKMAIELAGFIPLPDFAWIHAESQALGADVGKLIDRAAGAEREVVGRYVEPDGKVNRSPPAGGLTNDSRAGGTRDTTAPTTPLAQLFDGHHSRVRTNYEPICVGMKPLDGTWAENAEHWGCGGFNVEAGRVPTAGTADDEAYAEKHSSVEGLSRVGAVDLQSGDRTEERTNGYSPGGRFPSCVLFGHAAECEVDTCVAGCPVAALAEQGGSHRPGERPNKGSTRGALTGGVRGAFDGKGREVLDGGTADHFYFQARPSRRERSAGCEGLFWQRDPDHADGWRIVDLEAFGALATGERFEGNPHMALKSLELTRYLAKLLRQPGDAKLLVPFCGSGSEAIGAMLGGWRDVTAIDGSAQWILAAKFRETFWRPFAELGTAGTVKDVLRDYGPKRPPEKTKTAQGDLF